MHVCRFPIPRITLVHTSHRNPKLGRNPLTGASKRRAGSPPIRIEHSVAADRSLVKWLTLFITVQWVSHTDGDLEESVGQLELSVTKIVVNKIFVNIFICPTEDGLW